VKIDINKQTATTIGILITLLIIEYLMSVLKVDYFIYISINIVLCVFFNIYNYRRFRHFQTKKDLQITNQRLAHAQVVINLTFIIGILALLIRMS